MNKKLFVTTLLTGTRSLEHEKEKAFSLTHKMTLSKDKDIQRQTLELACNFVESIFSIQLFS